jgi:hypothetical protein
MVVCVFVLLFWYLFLEDFSFSESKLLGDVLVVRCSFGAILLRGLKSSKTLLKKSRLGLLSPF